MNKILLIGATGQLGTAIFERLCSTNSSTIRIFVREDSSYDHLQKLDVEIFFGDLTNLDSIRPALESCDVVISTANAVIPRTKHDTLSNVDVKGHCDLIDASVKVGVKQFIFTSAYMAPKSGKLIPLERAKLQAENYLRASGLPYTIFRPTAFMDIYFAFMGSTIPLNGARASTLKRPFPFMQNFYRGIKNDISQGKINIVGDGKTKQSFIALDNVSEFIVKSIFHPQCINQTFDLGGPQALSALEVKSLYELLLGRRLKPKKTPAFMLKILGNVFSVFNPAGANIFKLNYLSGTQSSVVDCSELADKLEIQLTSAEEFLRQKLSI